MDGNPGRSVAGRIVSTVPRLVITWIVNCVGLIVAAAIIPAMTYHGKIGTLLLAGLILAVVNFALRPLVILMTLPAVILSLGIGLLLVNALMLWITGKIVTGLHVGGFWSTVGGALVLWLVNLALRPWTRRDKGDGKMTVKVSFNRSR
jgi:putative membrane protein